MSIFAQLPVLQQGSTGATLAVKRRGVRAATADEVKPIRGVPIEASLGVIETPRIAAAALHAQFSLYSGLSSNDRLGQLTYCSCGRGYLSLRQITC